MTAAADNEGLAPSHRHQMDPCGPFPASGPVEISGLADVMDLKVRPCLADLAALGEEPVDQLVALHAGHDRPCVGECCRALPLERDPAEAGDQRLLPLITGDGDLDAAAWSVRSRCCSCTSGTSAVARLLLTSLTNEQLTLAPGAAEEVAQRHTRAHRAAQLAVFTGAPLRTGAKPVISMALMWNGKPHSSVTPWRYWKTWSIAQAM